MPLARLTCQGLRSDEDKLVGGDPDHITIALKRIFDGPRIAPSQPVWESAKDIIQHLEVKAETYQ